MFASKPAERFQCDAPDCGPRGCITADQYNEPNPILALWRETNDGDMRGWGVWLALAAHDMVQDGQATADHKGHARRVLTRLANLTKEN